MPDGVVETRGITFHYLERGAPDAPLALVLHGFPESPVSFVVLLDALAEAGYHAVAPWLRGYAPTSLAPDASYHVGSLAADANALHGALGGDGRAVLVGHDWGASAVYPALSVAPERWRRGVAMAVPPFAAMVAAMATVDQLRRSWYMWLLATPVGEGALEANGLALIDALWSQWSPGLDAASAAQGIAAAKAALAAPAHLAAATGYYRALFADPPSDPDAAVAQAAALATPPVPVCYLHGVDDGCIGIEAIGDPLLHLCEGSRYHRVAAAGHFLHVERPALVAEHVGAFLSG
jgi:pimeloyl-ACP methyl ester carboxylesterase